LLDYWDFINLIPIVVVRAVIIGVKYGFYSDDHLDILYKFKFSAKFLSSNLIGTIVNDKEPKFIYKKFKDVIEYLEIDLDTFYIEIDTSIN
jgi:hypothetical protein